MEGTRPFKVIFFGYFAFMVRLKRQNLHTVSFIQTRNQYFYSADPFTPLSSLPLVTRFLTVLFIVNTVYCDSALARNCFQIDDSPCG